MAKSIQHKLQIKKIIYALMIVITLIIIFLCFFTPNYFSLLITKQLANYGNAQAQYKLGQMYYKGDIVSQDSFKAVE